MHPTRRFVLTTCARRGLAVALGATAASTLVPSHSAEAASARKLTTDAKRALAALYGVQPRTRELARRARAVLVFPRIVKAGLLIGGQSGNGALLQEGAAVAFYTITAASFGLQAGVERFSYALFLMNDKALAYLDHSDGWAIGGAPNIVIADKGFARTANTTTLRDDVYAFPFGLHGLMAGIGLEGSKITRITPEP
jgi:lipid-binding SYLF domain-containing protein